MSNINWKQINYLLNEYTEWKLDDVGYSRDCAEELVEFVPLLIERIQKLAKEKSELERELKEVKRTHFKFKIPEIESPVDWSKTQLWNTPEFKKAFYDYPPKYSNGFSNAPMQPYDPSVWSNSTLRDSL